MQGQAILVQALHTMVQNAKNSYESGLQEDMRFLWQVIIHHQQVVIQQHQFVIVQGYA